MKRPAALFPVILLASWALLPAAAGAATSQAAAASDGSLTGILLSTALANLSVAFIAVLLLIGGLYAYASLARFAPYHSWIYLYLVSLAGIVWGIFLMNIAGSLPDAIFITTTVVGVNLIVHTLRFDRVGMPVAGGHEQVDITPFNF